jgi:hypothetical protein
MLLHVPPQIVYRPIADGVREMQIPGTRIGLALEPPIDEREG